MLCLVVVVVYGVTRGNNWQAWHQGFLAGIAMAMATLPEELPVVLTIFLALGAWRISRNNVLTRRIPAIETLGAATVLCVDKTGTLTQNRMSVSRLHAAGQILRLRCSTDQQALPEDIHSSLLEFGVLASRQDPFDPMEKAIRQSGEQHLGGDRAPVTRNWTLVREYPLSPELLALSHVWRSPDDGNTRSWRPRAPRRPSPTCAISAPSRSGSCRPPLPSMANDGLRVLGVAAGRAAGRHACRRSSTTSSSSSSG